MKAADLAKLKRKLQNERRKLNQYAEEEFMQSGTLSSNRLNEQNRIVGELSREIEKDLMEQQALLAAEESPVEFDAGLPQEKQR